MAFLDLFRTRRSAAPDALGRFLHAQGAYVAQKTVLDYCRVKSGRNEKRYFTDADFMAALHHCRWHVYFAALSDVAALIEAHIRPHLPADEALLAAWLVAQHAEILRREPPPDDELPSADQSRDVFRRHLAEMQAAPPVPAHRLPLLAEPILFATLPIHADQRKGESLAIRGALRFQIVTTQEELERRFDAPGLAKAISQPAQPSAANRLAADG